MEPTAYRERIYDIFAGPSDDVEGKVDRALAVGTEYLDLSLGFLTRIDGDTQEIVRVNGDHPLVRPGERCPLGRSYCRWTVDRERPRSLAVRDAAASSAVSDAAVETFGLGTYVGARVVVDDDTRGVVCFADEGERDAAFGDLERVFVELIARLVGQAFERRAYERELERRTDRLEAEKRRFEGIAETSHDVLFRVGPDAELTYVSSAVERILGYDPDELIGASFATIVTEGSFRRTLAAYESVFDGESVENLELECRDATGETVFVEVNATPIVDDGTVVGTQGVGRDVTARRERERELRVKNRAMDDATVGIVIADATRPDTPVVYANDRMSRLTGYAAAELVGESLVTVLSDSADVETTRLLSERIAADESASLELVNVRRDGTPYWNRVRVSPVEDEAGDVTHYLGFQTDVTDTKRTEQLLQLLNRVLRHNLRNDMNVILGYGRAIAELSDEDGEIAEFAARIDATADRLLALSEQAHELKRYARQERDPRRLRPADFLGDLVDRYRAEYPRATVDLRTETDADVCAGYEVERAVSELVSNALRHNPAADPWVGIEVVRDGDWVELAVTDDGPGIEAMEAAVIAKGEETAIEHGSGLGLWLVNWIVTRYGGSFRIRATDDGTAATIRLPRIGAETPPGSASRGRTALSE